MGYDLPPLSGADEFRKANPPNNIGLARKTCHTHVLVVGQFASPAARLLAAAGLLFLKVTDYAHVPTLDTLQESGYIELMPRPSDYLRVR